MTTPDSSVPLRVQVDAAFDTDDERAVRILDARDAARTRADPARTRELDRALAAALDRPVSPASGGSS